MQGLAKEKLRGAGLERAPAALADIRFRKLTFTAYQVLSSRDIRVLPSSGTMVLLSAWLMVD